MRWAAKNAANVAPTSSTKTARARVVTYGALSVPRTTTTSAGSVPRLVRAVGEGLRLLVDRLDARDVEQPRHVARLAALVLGVEDERVLARLVVAVVDPDHPVGVAGLDQRVALARREAVDEVPLRTTTTFSGRAAAARSPAPASDVGVPPGSAIGFGGGRLSSPERTMK